VTAPSAGRIQASFPLFSNNGDQFRRELEEKAERRAREKSEGKGGGQLAAGAILGGLVAGPFGALFGAQIGGKMGARNSFDKAKQEEMERMGVSQNMLEMAEDVGAALNRAFEGLQATRDSLQTQQSFARRLDNNAQQLYEQSKVAIEQGDEQKARGFLEERHGVQQRLKKAFQACAEEKQRLEIMERNVAMTEERAMEIETLLRRNVGAKALQDSSTSFSLSNEDPLLQKFRDLGID
jgi:hypothetical protein